eukprot:TRINITY_DN15749_c0_g1_i6.p1 TRINITY_DN15749_c0_g1~~TRINITY_DN15749_c0_g1_i6.p1  ORF type:complete len:347 (+),score=77.55 TRINITY_DN15749_c0_g1_i6:73-1041(+)
MESPAGAAGKVLLRRQIEARLQHLSERQLRLVLTFLSGLDAAPPPGSHMELVAEARAALHEARQRILLCASPEQNRPGMSPALGLPHGATAFPPPASPGGFGPDFAAPLAAAAVGQLSGFGGGGDAGSDDGFSFGGGGGAAGTGTGLAAGGSSPGGASRTPCDETYGAALAGDYGAAARGSPPADYSPCAAEGCTPRSRATEPASPARDPTEAPRHHRTQRSGSAFFRGGGVAHGAHLTARVGQKGGTNPPPRGSAPDLATPAKDRRQRAGAPSAGSLAADYWSTASTADRARLWPEAFSSPGKDDPPKDGLAADGADSPPR